VPTIKMHNLEGMHKTLHPNGYYTVYYPDHLFAWQQSGSVYYHRLKMENILGRYMNPDEHVHHKDGDPTNNSDNNLELVTYASHGSKHTTIPVRLCPQCKTSFKPDNHRIKCCSIKCSNLYRRLAERPSKEELQRLVWEKPTSQLAKKYGVSDNAVAKWCKRYGIEKPPRGYWS